MRLTQLATLLSLGAGSLSILIPSTTSLENSKVDVKISENAETLAIQALTQTLEIPCDSCPFYTGKDTKGAATFSQEANDLILTLSLDPLARDVINLNGAPMFPFIYTQSEPEPFTVTQKSKDSGAEAQVPVGLDLIIETDSHGVSRFRLHVLSVAGFQTQATMEILEFPVFQKDDGEIFIGQVNKRPPTTAEASAILCGDNMLCRWKAYLYDIFVKVTGKGGARRKGGCHGKGRKYKRPPHTVDSHEQPHQDKHHGKHHGEHHDGEEHHHHGWGVFRFIGAIIGGFFSWAGGIMRFIIACLVVAAITVSIGLFFTIFISGVVHIALVAWWFITGKYKKLNVRNYQVVVDEEEQNLMSKDEESQMDAPEYSDELPVYAENEEKH